MEELIIRICVTSGCFSFVRMFKEQTIFTRTRTVEIEDVFKKFAFLSMLRIV